MSDNQSIKETLEVIRKALQDDNTTNLDDVSDDVLVLNQLVKEDGTINIINNSLITKEDVIKSLNQKIDIVFEKNLNNWLDENLPTRLDKYFKKKDI